MGRYTVSSFSKKKHATTTPAKGKLGQYPWIGIAAGGVALVATALAFVHFPEKPLVRSIIPPLAKTSFSPDVQLSPDGRQLVFSARSEGGSYCLWVRSVDSTKAQRLAGSESASFSYPFWSPDGRSIGFGADGKLKKIDLSGGPPVTLADVPNFYGASWSPGEVIVFAPNYMGPLLRIAAAGGAATPATVFDRARDETSHRYPWFLPDGRHFLYVSVSITNDATICVGSLDSDETRIVSHTDSKVAYASGYLLFLRGNTLMAQPFDAKRLTTTGEAVPFADQIAQGGVRGFFAVSDNGAIVFQSDEPSGKMLAWLDRTGKLLATVGEPGQLLRVFLSPDGKRATVSVFDPASQKFGLWIYDLERNLRSRFAFDQADGDQREGVWPPDGSQIVFSSTRGGHANLYRKPASGAGAEVLLYADDRDKHPTSWSRDGKFVMYYSTGNTETGADIWVLPQTGERKPFRFLKTHFSQGNGQFSPDGHWIAYQSKETGRFEIYIAPFSGSGGERRVSLDGGVQAHWRADGKELFYIAPDGRLMSAEIGIKGAEAEIGAVRPLFGTLLIGNGYQYDVSPDGQRFLSILPNEQASSEALTMLQNWTAGLKK